MIDLLGVFVADKNYNWIDVNAVKSFYGMWSNIKQAVTPLGQTKTQNITELLKQSL